MTDEKDKFGETMKLVERAQEDIYFAERERDLIAKLKGKLQKVAKAAVHLRCPKCPGQLETYTFQGYVLDRCDQCGGIWMDKGELEGVVRKVSRGPLGEWMDKLAGTETKFMKKE
ncbi:MAG TPA: zf-TFIIB domain-containing protein [Acidobacteriota bacterium]|nr:zf-TFIIB domain-containing protein [Acidobacteriota bacterium]